MEGVVTEFVLPGPSTYLEGICKGPDGAVWFTVTLPDRVGRISPAGSITELPRSPRSTMVSAGSRQAPTETSGSP